MAGGKVRRQRALPFQTLPSNTTYLARQPAAVSETTPPKRAQLIRLLGTLESPADWQTPYVVDHDLSRLSVCSSTRTLGQTQ